MNNEIDLDTAMQALEQYETDNRPTRKTTNKEAVLALKGKIEAMLEKGFTYDDISKALEKAGLKLKAATIREYLKSGNATKAKRKRATTKKELKNEQEKPIEKSSFDTEKQEENLRTSSNFSDDNLDDL